MATATKTPPSPAGFVRVQVSLNWSDSGHWDGRWQRACPFCGLTTNLRDNNGEAAHKTCVESDIEAQAVQYAQSLLADIETKVQAYAQSLLPAPAARKSRATVKAA
jgi:hypothetical protein